MARFRLNGEPFSFEGDDDTPLLWAIREGAGLKGAKYGCGIGQCGACTVHLNGRAVRACSVPVSALSDDDAVRTIEGLADGDRLHPVQEAWIEEDAPQCGYCQTGQIMAIAAFLERRPDARDEDIDLYHDNLCRCGSYFRLRKAIKLAAANMGGGNVGE